VPAAIEEHGFTQNMAARALAIADAARDAGYATTPVELAIAGFDCIAGSDNFQPVLTSVVQPFEEAGRSRFDFLLAALRGEGQRIVTHSPRPVVRESTLGFGGPGFGGGRPVARRGGDGRRSDDGACGPG
jgi:hypothetical protein